MSNYPNAGKGLKKLYIAAIGALVCSILMFIPLVNIVAVIGILIFSIISILGLWAVGKDISGCKTAFWLTIGSCVVNVIENFLGTALGTVFSIASTVLSLAVTYYICTSVAAVLRSVGETDAALAGDKAWKITLGSTVISVVASVLGLIPIISVVGSVLDVIAAIVSIVATVFYVIFLNKALKVFGT